MIIRKPKKTIKKFNLKTSYEWEEFIKKNNISKHIPRSPEHYYKKNKGWKGWKGFLVTLLELKNLIIIFFYQ